MSISCTQQIFDKHIKMHINNKTKILSLVYIQEKNYIMVHTLGFDPKLHPITKELFIHIMLASS